VSGNSALFEDLPEQVVPEAPGRGTPRLRQPQRHQPSWQIVAIDDLVTRDHPVRAVWAFVQRLDLRALHDACSSDGLYFELPAGLERRIRSAARREVRTAGALRLAWRPWLAVAAAVLVLAGLVVVLLLRNGSGAENALAEQVVADHVRAWLFAPPRGGRPPT